MTFSRSALRYADREPVVFFSVMLSAIGFGLPLVVVPVRRALGFSTIQYSGSPSLPPAGPLETRSTPQYQQE